MCRRILIITIVVFVLQLVTTRDRAPDVLVGDGGTTETNAPLQRNSDHSRVSEAQNWLQMDTPKVLRGQVWRLLTSAFCHAIDSPMHILFNMLLFWWFAPRLEAMYGSREFLLFYLAAALVASFAYLGLDLVTGNPRPMVGASGAVMAVLMLFALHFPHQIVYVFFVIPLEVRWIVLLYAVFDIYPLLFQLSGNGLYDNVAHAAHLGGLAFGYFYGRRQWRLAPYLTAVETKWKARRRGLKVVGASPPASSRRTKNLADEMDAILQKISEHGEGSLTSRERKTLERASRELRERRQ